MAAKHVPNYPKSHLSDFNRDVTQKRQRIVTSRDGLADTEKISRDLIDAGEVGGQFEDENLGANEASRDTGVLLTDNDCDDKDEDLEGDYDYYNRVAQMVRWPDLQDEIDHVIKRIDSQRGHCTSLFTCFQEGKWSQRGILIQMISVKIVEGAGKYLFGKILARNYRNEMISFYNRDNNNCQLLGEKAVATLHSPYRVLQISDEVDIYFDLSTKDSENSSEVRSVGRGVVSWRCIQMRPGIFSDLVRGEQGTTRVTYAVIFGAVEAVVGVKIIGRSAKNLHAKVVAISEMFSKVVLFSGVLGDVLQEEESVPLQNSVLAVLKEEGQKLKISVSLGDDEMGRINYCATFNPKLSSCDTTNDKVTKYGTLQVKVAWSAVPFFPERYLKKLHDNEAPCSVQPI